MSRESRAARGMTLVEVMISMSVLLIGLLGMMSLQIWGMNSNQGARANTMATQLARELVSGLERLPFADARLAGTDAFGGLLQADGTVVSTGFTSFADVPGVRGQDVIELDRAGELVYQRRWTVQVEKTASGEDCAKLIAVSVVYRERGIPHLKEVVVYGYNIDRRLLARYLGS